MINSPSIEVFIQFCLAIQLPFDIVGNFDIKIIEMLKHKYKLPHHIFKGQQDTITYLKHNIGKYLFAGGLGQVVLEAGALGMPCFIPSLQCLNKSFFVTVDNYKHLVGINFSPSIITQPRFELFMKERAQDFYKIHASQTTTFNVAPLVKLYNNFDDIFDIYYTTINK